ncbi:TPA: hypothetical protein ACIBS5_005163 [Salmonella enterica subsp. diarizonae serovar 60-67:z35:-]
MTSDTLKSVNAAIKWYQYDNEKAPNQRMAHRDRLREDLTTIAKRCCDEDKEGDVDEIGMLIEYLNNGKELKPVPLPEFSI